MFFLSYQIVCHKIKKISRMLSSVRDGTALKIIKFFLSSFFLLHILTVLGFI